LTSNTIGSQIWIQVEVNTQGERNEVSKTNIENASAELHHETIEATTLRNLVDSFREK